MAALPYSVLPAGSLPQADTALRFHPTRALWLALQILDPPPDSAALESLAEWAGSLTSIVVLRPGEGLLLEVRGSCRYFSGLAAIRQRLSAELERRGWAHRLATAPTPLAASWLARCAGSDIPERASLAGALGRLPIRATAWPERVQRMLGQMGLSWIADCLRLPRAGFARRVGQAWLDELDRAIGNKPDPRDPWRPSATLQRLVEFPLETSHQLWFAEALGGMADELEHELRRRQAQIDSITLAFRHLRQSDTLTRIRFVDPVHERDRILQPLLARIERLALAEPAVALSLETSKLLALKVDLPELLPTLSDRPVANAGKDVSEFALVECLRGRFGTRSVYGISSVAEHRPEHAWCRWVDRPNTSSRFAEPAGLAHGRPLWLLPEPQSQQKWGQSPFSKKWGQSPFLQATEPDSLSLKKGSDPIFAGPVFAGAVERIESGWWDGQDVRRDYHVVISAAGEKLWLYRDRLTHEWYLHGIFG
jgi:protein ImuB